jgi:ribosome-associated protein
MNLQKLNAEGKSPALAFALAAAELAANTRCENVVLLDLRGRSPVTEFFVLATGTSPRQMRTVVEEIRDLGKKMNFAAWQTSGLETGRWILIDCVSVVCHVFDEESRDFYDLELLWGDCPRIDWRKELGLPPESLEPRESRPKAPFHEDSGLDQIDAQEEQERELTETEGEGDMDEDADAEPPVVVEVPDESTGSNSVEFIEIDAPRTRGKREHALYPTAIGDDSPMEAEDAMHLVSAAGAGAEDIADEVEAEARPRRRSPAKKPTKVKAKKPTIKAAKPAKKKSGTAKKKPPKAKAAKRKK